MDLGGHSFYGKMTEQIGEFKTLVALDFLGTKSMGLFQKALVG